MQNRLHYLLCPIFPLMLLAGSAHAVSIEAWHAAVEPDNVQRVNISCGTNFLDPREIVVKKDVPLELVIRTQGSSPDQSLTILLPGSVLENIIGRLPRLIRVAPNVLGSFTLQCRTPGVSEDPKTLTKKRGILTIIP